MTISDRTLRRLGRYRDGELGRWGARRMAAELRESPELRWELEMLGVLGEAAGQLDAAAATPSLWDAIAGVLPDIDRHRARGAKPARAPELRVSETPASAWWGPRMGAALAAGALAVAAVVAFQPPPPVQISAAGSVRYLDTAGRSVMVIDSEEDVTIIWLIGPGTDEV